MKDLLQRLFEDETGVILSSEMALVGTVGVLGMVVGLESVSTAVNQELNDLSCAFRAVNQSYSYRTFSKGQHARVSGSAFTDIGVGANNCGMTQGDLFGQFGGGGFNQMLVQNSVPTVRGQIVQERVLEEDVVDAPIAVKAATVPCPEDEIIEEHIIRRRVKNDCATLNADCAKSSPPNVIPQKSNPAPRSAPDKVETKKSNK